MFDNLKIYICEKLCDTRETLRIVPRIGRLLEQEGPVAPNSGKVRRPDRRFTIMAFKMSDSQLTTVSVNFADKKGNVAQVDGLPEWSTDNPNVLSLTPAADGMSCKVSAVGPLGVASVTLKADADLGQGVTEIIGVLEVEITGGNASVVKLTPDTPAEQE